jgi:hypothetical protein
LSMSFEHRAQSRVCEHVPVCLRGLCFCLLRDSKPEAASASVQGELGRAAQREPTAHPPISNYAANGARCCCVALWLRVKLLCQLWHLSLAVLSLRRRFQTLQPSTELLLGTRYWRLHVTRGTRDTPSIYPPDAHTLWEGASQPRQPPGSAPDLGGICPDAVVVVIVAMVRYQVHASTRCCSCYTSTYYMLPTAYCLDRRARLAPT